jgi:hypothetical protein
VEVSDEYVKTVENLIGETIKKCNLPSRRRREVAAGTGSNAVCINNPTRPIIKVALEKVSSATEEFVKSQIPKIRDELIMSFPPGALFSNVDGEKFDLEKYFLEYHGK